MDCTCKICIARGKGNALIIQCQKEIGCNLVYIHTELLKRILLKASSVFHLTEKRIKNQKTALPNDCVESMTTVCIPARLLFVKNGDLNNYYSTYHCNGGTYLLQALKIKQINTKIF